ncbi:uncharacterized protein LOC143040360 isoform X2 [Oratosquilla oratoria]
MPSLGTLLREGGTWSYNSIVDASYTSNNRRSIERTPLLAEEGEDARQALQETEERPSEDLLSHNSIVDPSYRSNDRRSIERTPLAEEGEGARQALWETEARPSEDLLSYNSIVDPSYRSNNRRSIERTPLAGQALWETEERPSEGRPLSYGAIVDPSYRSNNRRSIERTPLLAEEGEGTRQALWETEVRPSEGRLLSYKSIVDPSHRSNKRRTTEKTLLFTEESENERRKLRGTEERPSEGRPLGYGSIANPIYRSNNRRTTKKTPLLTEESEDERQTLRGTEERPSEGRPLSYGSIVSPIYRSNKRRTTEKTLLFTEESENERRKLRGTEERPSEGRPLGYGSIANPIYRSNNRRTTKKTPLLTEESEDERQTLRGTEERPSEGRPLSYGSIVSPIYRSNNRRTNEKTPLLTKEREDERQTLRGTKDRLFAGTASRVGNDPLIRTVPQFEEVPCTRTPWGCEGRCCSPDLLKGKSYVDPRGVSFKKDVHWETASRDIQRSCLKTDTSQRKTLNTNRDYRTDWTQDRASLDYSQRCPSEDTPESNASENLGPSSSSLIGKGVVIIGSGDFGCAMVFRLQKAGILGIVASRSPQQRRQFVEGCGGVVGSYSEVLPMCRIVVLAVPHESHPCLPSNLLQDKILIDVSNRDPKKSSQPKSNAEVLQEFFPQSHVVKAFNTLSAYSLQNGAIQASKEVPICGNNAEARAAVGDLARSLGFQPVDCGGLASAAQLEQIPLRFFSIEWKFTIWLTVSLFFIAWIFYLFRLQLCRGIEDGNWRHVHFELLPLTNTQLSFAMAATILLALCYLPGVLAAYLQLWRGTKYSRFPNCLDRWLRSRKHIGLMALLLGGLHCIMAILENQGHGTKYSWDNGLRKVAGGILMGLLLLLGVTSLPSVTATLSWREFTCIQSKLGWLTLVVACVHIIFVYWPQVFQPSFLCVVLPRGPQLSLIIPFITILLKLPLLLPCVNSKLTKIRKGHERDASSSSTV